MTPTNFTEVDYAALNRVFSGGNISACSKPELERFAVMLSRPNAFTHFGASSFPQICETVRTLILVRISEDANKEASRISIIALRVAIVALIVTGLQTVAAIWPLVSTERSTLRNQDPIPIAPSSKSIPTPQLQSK